MSSGVVYVLVESEQRFGIGGSLVLDTGQVMWGHVSSSMGYLVGDLTSTFQAQRDQLQEMFPDGYEVTVLRRSEPEAQWLVEANEAWASALDAGEDSP